MAREIIDLLHKGAEANKADKFREGNLICLPADGDMIITGDIHGHQRNLERIVSFADLENNPKRHVILQELIHGGPEDLEGGCLSYKLLFDAVGFKISFPDQVHIILGNHDTAFISDSEVLKNGKEMNRAMRQALRRQFGQSDDNIVRAIEQLLFSQPLAAKTKNKIWISHSLPSDRYIAQFDPEIFDRTLEPTDLSKPGSAYLLTWGRNFTQSLLDKMAALLDVEFFILGHQTQQKGWSRPADNLIIITSEHNHGCLIRVDLAKSYTIEELADSIVPLASIM